MKKISARDMAALKDARGVLEAIDGNNLSEVDALIDSCRVGKVGSVTGLPTTIAAGRFLYEQVRLFLALHPQDKDAPRAMAAWRRAIRSCHPGEEPGL